MFHSTSDLLDYVSGIKFTSDMRLGDMLNAHEFETVSKVVEGSLSIVNADRIGATEKILNLASLHVKMLTKQAPPSNAVILMILFVLKHLVTMEDTLWKYKSTHDFLRSYPEFCERETSEHAILYENAIWMNILFRIIPAKKNKGLALDVVPKFVEGFSASYITGSGQTRQTADRVKIYEREGNVSPAKRFKWKTKGAVQLKRPYKKRDSPKYEAYSAHQTKQARCTLKRVAEGVVSGRFGAGEGEVVRVKRAHFGDETSRVDMDNCHVGIAAIPPVPFSRRESSFGRAAAAVVFDNCSDPTSLLRSMSLLSDTSVDAMESMVELYRTQSSVYNDSNWCAAGNVELDDYIGDFQPFDQNYFPHLLVSPLAAYGEECCT